MSGADVTPLINSNHGNLSKILASEQTLFSNRGYDTTNIFAVDNSAKTLPLGAQANFGGEDRFRLRKRGGRIHKAWLRYTISAGVVAAGMEACYADDMSQLARNVRVEYASKTIQEYNAEVAKAYCRLMYHDISREAYNAQTFASLPPGAGGAEAIRQANVSTALTVFVPLHWLWFCRSEDYALTPESLASELDLLVLHNTLERLVYARKTSDSTVPTTATLWTTQPVITKCELFTQLIHTTQVEKALHLATFESQQGNIYKILVRFPLV